MPQGDEGLAGEPGLSTEDVAAAERLAGLEFTASERDLMLEGLGELRGHYRALRDVPLANGAAMALQFRPRTCCPAGPAVTRAAPAGAEGEVQLRLDTPEDVAYCSVADLARLLRARRVTSLQLTELYLERLRRYAPLLKCVVTLTEDRALTRARLADAEMAAGQWRGPLHGIPWGAKDLLATAGYPTTWGAEPYRDQMIDGDAAVVRRLDAAGAVLAAKLSLGALAWGDVWFGGQTRNPWEPERGSGGSSAGSAAATAAGLVGFAIGSETCGSIVSPATECGATGLRPTYGRVSRHGAMVLAWSMDKLGPLCRTAEDCALVFAAIHGADPSDPTTVDKPFDWPVATSLAGIRVGYLREAFAREHEGQSNDWEALEAFRSLGAEVVPIDLPHLPIEAMSFIMDVEAAAAFDELTRSDRDDMLARQVRGAWPNVFRQSRLVPAVEYVQANRVRLLAMQAMAELMDGVDLYLAPREDEDNCLLTNLTGQPALALPNGFLPSGRPTGIVLQGRLYGEAALLAAGVAYQGITQHHRRRPPLPR
ncbi:MAG: amidase [Anaerolineae bacterium]